MQSNNLKHDLNHTHNFNDLCRVGSEIQLPEFPKIVLAIILNSVPSILKAVLKTMTLSTQSIAITIFMSCRISKNPHNSQKLSLA